MIRFVTFDCAGTLIRLHCSIEQAAAAAARVGDPEAQLLRTMYLDRLPAFHALNLKRDPQLGRQFWLGLLRDWLASIGQDPEATESLHGQIEESLFGQPSVMFTLYDDVVPCLEALRARGITMAVLSNWDYSLHRVLKLFEVDRFFEVQIASLEEGTEKPDPRLFQLALERLGATPEETAHVGDDRFDDVEGAQGAGIQPVLIDRSPASLSLHMRHVASLSLHMRHVEGLPIDVLEPKDAPVLHSLSELEALLWSD